MLKQKLAIAIIFLGILSCSKNQNTKTEREGEPTIYTVPDTDEEMNDAIKIANQTLETFNEALRSENPIVSYFALKTRFDTPDGSEHIWLSIISFKDNKYFGVVDNLPESTTEVNLGDTIQITNDNISDWMYIDNQKLQGGYTIRLLRNRMSEEERKMFDAESGLIIED